LRRNLFVTGGLWVAEGGYAQVSKSTMRADSWTGSAHSRGMTASCRNQGRTVTLKIDSSAKLEIGKLSAIARDKMAKGCGAGEGANADVDISEVGAVRAGASTCARASVRAWRSGEFGNFRDEGRSCLRHTPPPLTSTYTQYTLLSHFCSFLKLCSFFDSI
jgi:hypothetical protein